MTFYWPSSPSSGGNYENSNVPDNSAHAGAAEPPEMLDAVTDGIRLQKLGTVEQFVEVLRIQVGLGQIVADLAVAFTAYRKHHYRFLSEFGFQSFPALQTVRRFTEKEDRNIYSRVMEMHQRNTAIFFILRFHLVVAAPEADAGMGAEPADVLADLRGHVCLEGRRQLVGCAGEHEIVPDQKAALVAYIIEEIVQKIAAAPDTDDLLLAFLSQLRRQLREQQRRERGRRPLLGRLARR